MRQVIHGIAFCALLPLTFALPASADALPAGFVRLADVDPSIRQDIRYAGLENFLHRKADGYDAPVCILTRQAAQALSGVQKALASDGLTLVVFDCYRPARAVADMGKWTREGGPPDPQWYPLVKRGDLIAKGYIGELSTHSRGSTVDVAIARSDGKGMSSAVCGAAGAATLVRHQLRLFRSGERNRPPPARGRCGGQPQKTARCHARRRLQELCARVVALHAGKRAVSKAALRLPRHCELKPPGTTANLRRGGLASARPASK